jgi:hypothetical protein
MLAGGPPMDDSGRTAGAIVLIIVGIFVYFVPSMVAFRRDHEQRIPIFLLNIFLGWSFVGWVVALIWAALRRKSEPTQTP